MKLRCTLDGLLLDATVHPYTSALEVYDSGESFILEALEALYYEVVAASCEELVGLQRGRYRLLRCSEDFRPSLN